MSLFAANGLRAFGTAVWAWWLVFGIWDAIPIWVKGSALPLSVAVAWRFGSGRPFWPSLAGEKPVLLSCLLLVLNTFCFRQFGLTPRLSFLTAVPVVLMTAFLADRIRRREPFRGPAERLWKRMDRHRLVLAGVFLVAFNLWFSLGGWLRFRAMNVEFWDVGSISQAMSNMAHGFGYTRSVPGGTLSNRFAQHFEPLFYLLSPVMRADRGVEIMLILQTLSISLAAVFIGLAMERVVRHAGAFWIGLAGLCLHPATGFPLFTDFHGDVFAVLPLSIMLWALAAGRTGTFWFAFLGAAACKEYSMIATAGIALAMLWQGRREPALRRQGLLLLGSSAFLLLALEVWFMPLFRPDDLPSVLEIHMGKFRQVDPQGVASMDLGSGHALQVVFNLSNLSNLFQALLPFSAYLFAGPAALLGASLNIAKDMIFGFDVGNHHFAPALPILFVGTAWAIRDSVQEGRRVGALFQMGICLLLTGILWGPGYWGRIGRVRMAQWVESAPAADKTHRLFSGADPRRPKMVTGALGGILFRAPELYFLGTSGAKFRRGAPPADLEVYAEMWDQPFPDWALLGDVQDDLAAFISGKPIGAWLPLFPGLLAWVEAGAHASMPMHVQVQVSESAAPVTGNGQDTAASISMGGWAGMAGPSADQAYALVMAGEDGGCTPMGLRAPGRSWLMFKVWMNPGWEKGATLRLLSAPSPKTGTAALKNWDLLAERPLDKSPVASGALKISP